MMEIVFVVNSIIQKQKIWNANFSKLTKKKIEKKI